MSSVKTQSRYDASRHLNFISTAPFDGAFFTYSTSMNASYQTIGALNPVTGATAANCPAGRILRANNKKLYPDAAGLDAVTYPNRTPLVGVFDYQTGLSGFIDPNNAVFALYNVDKPVDSIDGTAGDGSNNHRGMSVYTGGNVTAVGNISSTSGNLEIGTGRLTVGANVAGQTTLVAGTKAITVTGLTTASLAFVSLVSSVPGAGSLTVSHRAVCTANTITITALVAAGTINNLDLSVVNYFVVN